MKIKAEIKPVPLARYRDGKNGGKYLDARNKKFRQDLGLIASAAMAGNAPFQVPLKVKLDLYKNISATAKNYGDADNHAKAILDALNKIVWTDDKLVVSLEVHKHKSKLEFLEIEIEEIKNAL